MPYTDHPNTNACTAEWKEIARRFRQAGTPAAANGIVLDAQATVTKCKGIIDRLKEIAEVHMWSAETSEEVGAHKRAAEDRAIAVSATDAAARIQKSWLSAVRAMEDARDRLGSIQPGDVVIDGEVVRAEETSRGTLYEFVLFWFGKKAADDVMRFIEGAVTGAKVVIIGALALAALPIIPWGIIQLSRLLR